MSGIEDLSPFFREAVDIAELVDEKQKAYGNSHAQSGEILKILYPHGIPPEEFVDALTIVRVIDKLFRIANDKGAFNENPWKDIMGYALLSVVRDKHKIESYIDAGGPHVRKD